jgi:hypothetical protein
MVDPFFGKLKQERRSFLRFGFTHDERTVMPLGNGIAY